MFFANNLGHTLSPLQIQVGFYRAVVAPLFEEWHRLVNSRLSTAMLHHFVSNQVRFYTSLL